MTKEAQKKLESVKKHKTNKENSPAERSRAAENFPGELTHQWQPDPTPLIPTGMQRHPDSKACPAELAENTDAVMQKPQQRSALKVHPYPHTWHSMPTLDLEYCQNLTLLPVLSSSFYLSYIFL